MGYDSHEDITFEVAKHSIEKRSSVPVDIFPLKRKDLKVSRPPFATSLTFVLIRRALIGADSNFFVLFWRVFLQKAPRHLQENPGSKADH